MESFKNKTSSELSKILRESQAELKRRENAEAAQKEISAILKTYDLTIDDLDFGKKTKSRASNQSKTNKSRKATKTNKHSDTEKAELKKPLKKIDERRIVVSKYKHPVTNEKWSGRGRPPKWVVELCDVEKISTKKFKEDERFRI